MSSGKSTLYIAFALLLPVFVSCQDQTQPIAEEFRLPGDVKPTKYYLQIFTSLVETDYSFWGSSTIEIECVSDTQQIILHISELTIKEEEVVLSYIDGDAIQNIAIESHSYNTDFEFYIINISEVLVAGNQYSLYIPYSASLEDALDGYVRTSYVDEQSGETIWFASTYLEVTFARKVFPCFDEPAMKAVFSISLAHADCLQSLSNMPVLESNPIQDMEGWVMDVFEDTPLMSSYLVSILVSQFEYIELPNMNKPVRIWAQRDSINQMKMVEEIATRVFPFLENLFSFPYPLPKLDIVAVPCYKSNMESLGCVMLREGSVLYNPDTASIYDPTDIAAEVSMLLAHQWFGDIVTVTFWNEWWVAYGLAHYYREIGVAHFMSIDTYSEIRFVSKHRNVMNDDSLFPSSRSLIFAVDDPKNVAANWDFLSANKSYFVIRMLNMIVGPDAFLQGITNYLQNFQFSVAAQYDFFTELNNAGLQAQTLSADIDLNVAMKSWTIDRGYPIVTVSVNFDEQVAYLSQTRFLSETGATDEEKQIAEKQCWSVPISYTTKQKLDFNNILPQVWLTCESTAMLILENFTNEDWVMVNLKTMVPIRVNYDENNWFSISNTLLSEGDFTSIDVMNRMQLMSDSFEIAWPGFIGYKIPFTLAPYLVMENAEQPWRAALLSLRDIRNRLERSDLLESFKQFVRTFIEAKYSQYGSVDVVPDDILEPRFKLLIDSWACTYGVSPCLEQSLSLLQRWFDTQDPDVNNPIDIDVRDTVYCYGIQEGNRDLWNFMFDRFTQASDSAEKCRILYALGCSKDAELLAEYLMWSLDSTRIDASYSSTVFLSIYYSEQPMSFSVIFSFLTNNFQGICTALGEDTTTLCSYIRYIGDLIDSPQELQDFQAFVDAQGEQLNTCQSDVDAAYRAANNNVAWHNLHDQELADLLGSSGN